MEVRAGTAGLGGLGGGVFGEMNPKLDYADGTYYQLPIEQWASNRLNVCKAQ